MSDTFFQKKFLFYPVLLFLGIYFFDKLFGLEIVRNYTESRPEFTFYECKKKLLEQLKTFQKNKKEEKLLVLFGTSHMGEFSKDYIQSKKPDLVTYNFSAPMATPSYLLFNLTQIIKSGIKIDYAILEIIPETSKEEANEYALKFSYSYEFIFKYWNFFSRSELESFFVSNQFLMYRFPVKLNVLSERIKNKKSLQMRDFFLKKVNEAVEKNFGGIPNLFSYEPNEEDLKKEAEEFYSLHYSNYIESEAQKKSIEEFIKIAKENKIKLYIYRPILSKPYQDKLNQNKNYNSFIEEKNLYFKKEAVPIIDLTNYLERIKCKKFMDVHHLSGACYNEITDFVLKELK